MMTKFVELISPFANAAMVTDIEEKMYMVYHVAAENLFHNFPEALYATDVTFQQ